jgi:hypothetical protein
MKRLSIALLVAMVRTTSGMANKEKEIVEGRAESAR